MKTIETDEVSVARIVQNKLYQRGLTPVAARRVGSDLLGVTHTNSDIDVFALFSQAPHKYAQLSEYRDTTEWNPNDEPIDLHAWNVQKFGKLLKQSNPTAIGFLFSNTHYFNHTDYNFRELRDHVRENFTHMALYHQYLSHAESNYRKYIENGNDCTKGRQFYVWRAIHMARWIRTRGMLPPFNAFEMADEIEYMDGGYVLESLADWKARGKGSEYLHDICDDKLKEEQEADMEPTDERTKQPDIDVINEMIYETLSA
jgi:predicted nucleotidyltransferase